MGVFLWAGGLDPYRVGTPFLFSSREALKKTIKGFQVLTGPVHLLALEDSSSKGLAKLQVFLSHLAKALPELSSRQAKNRLRGSYNQSVPSMVRFFYGRVIVFGG